MESVVPNPAAVYQNEPLLMMTTTVVTDAGSSSGAGIPNLSPPVDAAQVRSALKRQVEYYFSRENINHDTYLVSQMDADQYVDISIIASFNQVKRLTSDMELLVDVMKESTSLQVDETGQKVRPLHKRSMIFLREIPEDTQQAEIEEMLRHNECPPFLSCEYATGQCWYIDFGTEDQAQEAFRYLRETVRTFKGVDIKARIKSKPSAVAIPTSRADQPRTEVPLSTVAAETAMRPPITMTSPAQPIRYPVPLHHIPLQNPPFAFPVGAAGQFQYMPSYVMHPVLPPPYGMNTMLPADPSYAYELGTGYGYPQVPSQPRPSSQNSNQGNSRDRKGHTRSAASSNSMPERAHESGHTAVSQSASTSASSKSSNSSQYYNSRNNSDSQNYHKHNGVSNRGRGYGDGHSVHERNYNSNMENMPPRLRNSAQRERNHNKDKQRISSHTNHFGQSTHSQMSSAPPRRSLNQQSHHQQRVGSTETNNSANGVGSLPHSRGASGPSSSGHEHRFEKNGTKEHSSGRQANANPAHAHNRNLGAHSHRNSRSPERDIEPTPAHDIGKSQSFELDSSAFPALPGATTAISPTAANAISSDSVATSVAGSALTTTTATTLYAQVPDMTSPDTKSVVAPSSDADKSMKTDSKLSDIVKNNIPELTKLADAARSKPSTSSKDSSEKSPHTAASKGQSVGKSQGAPSHPKNNRPAHLTNGIHSDKPVHSKGLVKPAAPASKPTEVEPGKHSEKLAQSNRKDSSEVGAHDAKATAAGNHASTTTSESKISYAAMAATTAATTTTKAPALDQSASSPTSPSSGDNNNNADSKSLPSSKPLPTNSKPDNLCYSNAAAKNTTNNPVSAHSPRKSASSQHYRNGPLKSKNSDGKPSPSSPTNRNAASSVSLAAR